MRDDQFERLYEADGVYVDWVTSPHHAGYGIVMDVDYRVRLAFSALADGLVSASFGEKLGDYFAKRNEEALEFNRSEIYITDDGQLVAMAATRYEPGLPFRQGFILDLPTAFVPAVRVALAKAFEAAEAKASAAERPA